MTRGSVRRLQLLRHRGTSVDTDEQGTTAPVSWRYTVPEEVLARVTDPERRLSVLYDCRYEDCVDHQARLDDHQGRLE